MSNNLFIFLCLFVPFLVAAQSEHPPHCGYETIEALLVQKNAALAAELEAYKAQIPSLERQVSTSIFRDDILTIPVVVHIIHPGHAPGTGANLPDSKIYEQLDILNKDYRRQNTDANATPSTFTSKAVDPQIEFCLAQVDPNGNASSGITRHKYENIPSIDYIEEVIKPSTNWNSRKYLNIWTVQMPNSSIIGYAYLPTSSIVGTDRDGLVVAHNRFGITSVSRGRTATHELGHYLGVQHPWGSQESCNSDDGISDTPSCSSPYFGCPSHPRSSCGTADMFMNFMDYVDDQCMNLFTEGQANVMRNVLIEIRAPLFNTALSACSLDLAATTNNLEEKLDLFPNPSTGQFTLKMAKGVSEKPIAIKIRSITGTILEAHLMKNGNTSKTFSLDHLPKGIYIVELNIEGQLLSKKILLK